VTTVKIAANGRERGFQGCAQLLNADLSAGQEAMQDELLAHLEVVRLPSHALHNYQEATITNRSLFAEERFTDIGSV